MSPTLEEQVEQLKNTIAEIESKRKALGDELVSAALLPFQSRLDELTALLAARDEPTPTGPAQQRKLVTLLFMDIAGSTAIAQHMDPEDVAEVFDNALKKLAAPVEAQGGRVTRFMGDGFLSVFGAPAAREDDPEQAVRAGLEIIELSHALAPQLETEWDIPGFQVRVGVNTGLVLLGGQTEAEDTLMGAAVNLAARLESAAPPGGLLISHDTYRHIRGVFDVEPLQPITAKGFDEPVRVYRVLRARPRAFRLHTRGVEGVETRMVGRETELKYLQDALLTAIEEGEGQMLTIIGEAGVGKSRLLYEFQDWIELLPPPHVRFFEGRARQEAQGLPYGLLRDLFAFRFQIQDDDGADIVREKIEKGLLEAFGDDDEGRMRAHILGQWLGYDFIASPHLKGVLNDPEQLSNRGRIYLSEYFKGLSAQGPVVLLMEDVHWADDSSLDALGWLGERIQRQGLLVVCAARPTLLERRPYWGEGLAFHRRINLEPLSRRESRQLVEQILRLAQEIPPELRELVVEGAEGNPFYLEELIKMLIENGVVVKSEETWHIEPGRLSEIDVPPTLAGVLQARLDSLPPQERAVLQQASVVGRQFWDRIVAYIQAAGEGEAEMVPQALTSLRGRELIYRREQSAFADAREYIFKHDILREVTYESVLKRLRKVYHGLVADWLIENSADRIGEYSGSIAEHLMKAGRVEQAGGYFLNAGQAALASYANAEAEGYFRRALELSPGDERGAAGLAGLGKALNVQGYNEEAIPVFRQAIELFLKLGEYDKAAELYARLSRAIWHDDYKKAWDACQEGLRRLEGAPESPGMARLLAETGRQAFFQAKSSEEVAGLCQRAIEMAKRVGTLEARVYATLTLAYTVVDITERFDLLEEVIASCEANGLWTQASIARNILGADSNKFLLNPEIGNQHLLSALEIDLKTGDVGGLFHSLDHVTEVAIAQGHFNTLEDTLAGILNRSSASPHRAENFLNEQRSWLLLPRGEWKQALEYYRQRREELRKGESIQLIVNTNHHLAEACLELNRFAGLADLSEAEAALRENFETGWDPLLLKRYWMVILLSRQERFKKAHELRDEDIGSLPHPETIYTKVMTLSMDAELARAERRWEEAVPLCETLVDIYQASGYGWWEARWMIDLGDAFTGRGGPGDHEQAQEAFRQALEMFSEMGAPGYIKVLEQRLQEF